MDNAITTLKGSLWSLESPNPLSLTGIQGNQPIFGGWDFFSADSSLHCSRRTQRGAGGSCWAAPVGRRVQLHPDHTQPSLPSPKERNLPTKWSMNVVTLWGEALMSWVQDTSSGGSSPDPPILILHLPMPCPMCAWLPKNHTAVLDLHPRAGNIGILRWRAAKRATWKLRCQTALGNEWRDNHYGWESSSKG